MKKKRRINYHFFKDHNNCEQHSLEKSSPKHGKYTYRLLSNVCIKIKEKTWKNTDRASSKEAVFLTSLFLFLGICTWFAILPHFNCRISRIIVKHKWLLMPKGDRLHKQPHGAHTQPCISWYFQLLFWIVPHLRVPPHFRIQSHYLHCSKLFTGLSSWHRR